MTKELDNFFRFYALAALYFVFIDHKFVHFIPEFVNLVLALIYELVEFICFVPPLNNFLRFRHH